MNKPYDRNSYGLAVEQAAHLRAGNLTGLDIENLVEEIDNIGRCIRNELVNRLVVLLQHLLKWEFQPTLRRASWDITMAEQRDRMADHIQENPSLKPKIPDAMQAANGVARIRAAGETGMPRQAFPTYCRYEFASALDNRFWPGG